MEVRPLEMFPTAERFKYNLISESQFDALLHKPSEELITYMMELSEANRHNPRDALVIRWNDMKSRPDWDFSGQDKDRIFEFEHPWLAIDRVDPPAPEDDDGRNVTERISNHGLIGKLPFEGNYVLAGGSIIGFLDRLIAGGVNSQLLDFDFYPIYDVEFKTLASAATQNSYETFFRDLNACFTDFNGETSDVDSVIRGEHCTTMYEVSGGDVVQLVHRGHPSPVSVVASFDQMICRAFWDGEAVYLTVEAALCWYFQINVIDWRRESPTHLQRAIKYHNRGYQIIFPGLLRRTFADAYLSNKMAREYFGRDGSREEMPYLYEILDGRFVIKGHFSYDRIIWTLDSDMGDEESSDYTETEGNHDAMVYNYGGLSAAIEHKRPIPYLIAKTILEMLEEPRLLDVRHVLTKISCNGYAWKAKYFGEFAVEMADIQTKLKVLSFSEGGRRKESRIFIMKHWELTQFVNLQNRANEILDALVKKYDPYLDAQRTLLKGVVFEIDNPGKQFSGSFSPIVRQSPVEYYGSSYHVDFKYQNLYEIKKLVLLQWKFGNCGVWRSIPKDIIKLIFKYFYQSYFVPSV